MLLGCCTCTGWENHEGHNEVQVQLDMSHTPSVKHSLMQTDSFDMTFTPRSFNGTMRPSSETPRQHTLRESLELPTLHTYPVPPSSTSEEAEEVRKRKLLDMYQEFALDLHTGMYLTQLTSNRDYSDIHCQLMEDMQTLKLDQSNGRIIEFPLTGVSKVYRIVKNDDKWYSAGSSVPGSQAANTEHIVVVEFMRRKLAFVFKELQVAQRFLMCMELLIRRAQQKQAKKTMRALTPAFPPQSANRSHCATPRQTQEVPASATKTPA